MRENIKNAGLILAIIIAGVSLPTSIISVMDKPITPITEVNNYYYNNTVIERYNDTVIVWVNNTVVVNETVVDDYPIPDRSKPIEYHTFISNVSNPYYIVKYNLSENDIYYIDCVIYPLRAQISPEINVVQESWLELWINSSGYYGEFTAGLSYRSSWSPPFLDTWCFIFSSYDVYLPNNWDWAFYDSILTIQE